MKNTDSLIYNSLNFYQTNSERFYHQTVNVDMREIYQPFLELIPDKGYILDLGCGSGRDTKYFLKLGYQVTAVDGSIEMVNLSSKLTGQPTLHLQFHELEFLNKFEGIWACASLLHVPRQEIKHILSLVFNSLKLHGILYLSFKYGKTEIIENDRLFINYDEELLTELLDIFSVEIVKIWVTKDKNRELKWLNGLVRKIN